jgi:uncharacterized protein YbbC (DUF1343 family)
MMSQHKTTKPKPQFRLFILLLGILAAIWMFAAQKRTKLGNEIFIQTVLPQLGQKKLGLVCNQTSILPDGRLLIEALIAKGARVEAVFAPEHGFRGRLEAVAKVQDSLLENIKIISLYGKSKRPTQIQTQSIDTFLFDIQDVGTRYYTYITTLKYVLEAAAAFGKPVYVLDRPNPAGGNIVEGPLLDPQYESFRGAFPIPVRYGLTIGELALMMKGEGWVPPQVELHVVRMTNWARRFFWEDTGLRWIPTSPNIPFPETAIIYPGTGLLGAFTINPGLGTSNPFLQFGAPWFDTKKIIQKLSGGTNYGVELQPLVYTPKSLPGKTLHPPYENRACQGIHVRISQKNRFYSLRFTLELIKAIQETHPEKIRLYPESLNQMFGNDLLERYIKGTLSYDDLLKKIKIDETAFLLMRQKYLLYE